MVVSLFLVQEGEQGLVHHPEYLRMGNLVVAGKRGIAGINWTRYFCEFRKKDQAQARVIKFTPLSKERRAGVVRHRDLLFFHTHT